MVPDAAALTSSDREHQPLDKRLAHLITEVLAPAPVVGTLLIIIAAHGGRTILQGLLWGLLAVVIIIPIPYLYVVWGVRQRRLSDRHVRLRVQRPLPMLIGISAVTAGLVLLSVLGAPRDLVGLIAAMVVGLVISLLVTLWWKISVHTAVVAGSVMILILVFGLLALPVALLVALVGWARIRLADHDVAQAAAGAALGTTVAAGVFSLLR